MNNNLSDIKPLLDNDGRLISFPSKHKKKLTVLWYLAGKIENGRQYSEAEINTLLDEWTVFRDHATLRRELYIEAHIKDIYGLECSDTTISRITDKILPVVREWQSRPLEEIYAVVFMDAIHFHVRSEGQIIKKAVYIAIGINIGNVNKSAVEIYPKFLKLL